MARSGNTTSERDLQECPHGHHRRARHSLHHLQLRRQRQSGGRGHGGRGRCPWTELRHQHRHHGGPAGHIRTYTFQTILEVTKSTGSSQPGGAGCGPASSSITYDANGNVSSRTDFNGKKSTYGYDLSRNLETSRTEGLANDGTALPETRTMTTAWHPTWRLPLQIDEYAGATATGNPLRRTQTTYDDRGNVTSRSVTDVTAGQTRTWTTAYTYSTALPGYPAEGRRRSAHRCGRHHRNRLLPPRRSVRRGRTGHRQQQGLPRPGQARRRCPGQACDYPLRRRWRGRGDHRPQWRARHPDLRPAAAAHQPQRRQQPTSFQYDPVGQLTKLTHPDGSFIAYTYDDARRLTEVADPLGNRIVYTLDAAANRTKEEIKDPQGQLIKSLTRAYDALGRLQTHSGVGGN